MTAAFFRTYYRFNRRRVSASICSTSGPRLSSDFMTCALAATVFRNRAQEGKRRSGWGDERRCLPMSFVVKHGIENNEELAHTGDERGLGVLTVGAQPQIESSDGGIAAHSRHRRHIQDAPHLCASAPDTTTAPHISTVAVEWCETSQCGDLLAIEHSQFRQLREQSTREHLADPGHGAQQLVAFTPQGSLANQLGEFSVQTGEPLFQPTDVLIDDMV